jgi:hypothetical protein
MLSEQQGVTSAEADLSTRVQNAETLSVMLR